QLAVAGRRVDERGRGARIAIPRLPDGARVDQVHRPRLQHDLHLVRVAGPGDQIQTIGRTPKRDGDVRVAEQAKLSRRGFERAQAVELVEDVRVLVERRPVANLDALVHDNRARWQVDQVVAVLDGQGVVRPLHGASGDEVEAFAVF